MTENKKEVELTMIDKDTNSKTIITLNQVKEYKFHKYELRTNIINQIQSTNTALPHYHIILSYYQKHTDRNYILKQHRFIKNNMEELFNPKYRNEPTYSSYFFFTERHKTYLSGSDGNKYYLFNQVNTSNDVLNTITNNVEYDVCDKEVVKGAYHSHILKSKIPDKVLFQPNNKQKKLLMQLIGSDKVPDHIDHATCEKIKGDLLTMICRRSEIVGNSNASVKVVNPNDEYYYDGFYGWKGLVSYATKTCYNADMMIDVIDSANSSINFNDATIPIEVSNKTTFIDNNEN